MSEKPNRPSDEERRERYGGTTVSDLYKIRSEISRLDAMGLDSVKIQARLRRRGYELTIGQVRRNVAHLDRVCTRNLTFDRERAVREKIRQLRHTRELAIAAWNKSNRPTTSTTKELKRIAAEAPPEPKGRGRKKAKPADEGELLVVALTETVEGRLPHNPYLQTILETIKLEMELLGLDTLPSTNITVNSGNSFDWNQFLTIKASQTPDESEAAIAAVLALPPKEPDGPPPSSHSPTGPSPNGKH